MTNHTDLLARLRAQSKSSSAFQKQMAQAKSLRQGGHEPPRDDLYYWPEPEQTLEGKAATALEALSQREARLVEVPEPVAWMYEAPGNKLFASERNELLAANSPPDGEWVETPLYARAALAEGGEK